MIGPGSIHVYFSDMTCNESALLTLALARANKAKAGGHVIPVIGNFESRQTPLMNLGVLMGFECVPERSETLPAKNRYTGPGSTYFSFS